MISLDTVYMQSVVSNIPYIGVYVLSYNGSSSTGHYIHAHSHTLWAGFLCVANCLDMGTSINKRVRVVNIVGCTVANRVEM